eukprot:TRINITY_DN831_c0_g9_i1.p1 TRINITY_DN831_c0_g9~~TRINITY_DN831_c0_g9_i1.p1  ORF type:complete len:474 (-),score=85.98 TRINITY_DN831_c0_g9_i1:1266-2687(-)
MGGCVSQPLRVDKDSEVAAASPDGGLSSQYAEVNTPRTPFSSNPNSKQHSSFKKGSTSGSFSRAGSFGMSPSGGGSGKSMLSLSRSRSKRGSQTPAAPADASNLTVFSRKEIEAATDNFTGKILGEGGFGKVYMGWLRNPSAGENAVPVAIKRLTQQRNIKNHTGYQEWLAELVILSKFQHPNLVALIGYCAEKNEAILVYECAERGSLQGALFGAELLPWTSRLAISIDVARGLGYLHSQRIIHRDVKPSNVLLRQDMTAMVADVGLAKSGPRQNGGHVTTNVKGTSGYLDPSYCETGHLGFKSDVFSFGVVLLELVIGRPTFGSNEKANLGASSLVEWVRPHLKKSPIDLELLVDHRLKGDYPATSVRRVLLIASRCVRSDLERRPTFDEIAEALEAIQKQELTGVDVIAAEAKAEEEAAEAEARKIPLLSETPSPLPDGLASKMGALAEGQDEDSEEEEVFEWRMKGRRL